MNAPATPNTSTGLASFLIACLVIAATLCIARAASSDEAEVPAAEAPGDLTLDDLRTFTDVFNAVRKYHVDPVDERDLLDAALRGMIASLDPYSAFLAAEDFQAHDAGRKGRQAGIGVELSPDERQRLLIRDVVRDGPAWRAGIRPGELLLSVDGTRVRGRPLNQSIAATSGAPGTSVVLRVRGDGERARTVTVQRAWVPVPSVRGRLLDGAVALLVVDRFHDRTDREFEERLGSLEDEAGGDLAAIVIDLRDNPGGVIQPAAVIADGFLDAGVVVTTQGRYPASHLEYHALPGQWARGVPLAILVNRRSASASEILAGALQDHGRALVVGTRTWGKGSVQSVLELRNGSALKLTTARYHTASGRSLDRGGIEPDVAVASPVTDVEGAGIPGRDPVLDAALAALGGKTPRALSSEPGE